MRRLTILKSGDILIWRVRGKSTISAEAVVKKMGALSDIHGLGDWAVGPLGLGEIWWFELILAEDIDEAFVKLLFNRMPDGRY